MANDRIAVGHLTSPNVSAYPWSAGFGTKYADPGTPPTDRGRGVAFGTSDIAVAHFTTPFVSAYPWSAGFGTKYANPGTLPAGTGYGAPFGAAAAAPAAATPPRVMRLFSGFKIRFVGGILRIK